jgi:Fe-S-cluster containining protein
MNIKFENRESMNLPSDLRRKILNQQMQKLISSGKDCFSCVGHCCTFEHNSMRVSPLEAMDVVNYLDKNNRINESLVKELEDCIRQFRLDKELFVRRDQELRRYYTCPFYKKDKLGCTIGKHHKPYGCLAFNPREEEVSVAGHCHSYSEVLEQRDDLYNAKEKQLNLKLKTDYQIYWDKKDLPSAVLYLIKRLYSF